VSAARVHPLALVEPGAVLADDVEIGPFCRVDATARIGARTKLLSHVVIGPHTALGADNVVHPGATLGGPPQDRSYQGEPTRLTVGDSNLLRECVTINRGTVKGGGHTRVGSRNMLMACSHIGHDSTVGDDIVMANGVLIAGHVHVGDRAVLAGAVAVHHFVRIGRLAYVGGMSRVVHDVPPFTKVAGERVRVRALNVIGLQRGGVAADEIEALRELFNALFRRKTALASAVAALDAPAGGMCEELLAFVREWAASPAGRYLEQFRTDRPAPRPSTA
jgi:UDP-N-acetylglucosamine acyltransferase